MTMKRQVPITCPQCNHTQNMQIWQTMNVTVSPEDKEMLFSEDFHVFTCENCDNKTPIDAAFMYHDMEKKFAVYCFPPQSLDEQAFFSQFEADASLKTFKNSDNPAEKRLADMVDYLRNPHIVFNINELRIYVVFRDRLAQFNTEDEA